MLKWTKKKKQIRLFAPLLCPKRAMLGAAALAVVLALASAGPNNCPGTPNTFPITPVVCI